MTCAAARTEAAAAERLARWHPPAKHTHTRARLHAHAASIGDACRGGGLETRLDTWAGHLGDGSGSVLDVALVAGPQGVAVAGPAGEPAGGDQGRQRRRVSAVPAAQGGAVSKLAPHLGPFSHLAMDDHVPWNTHTDPAPTPKKPATVAGSTASQRLYLQPAAARATGCRESGARSHGTMPAAVVQRLIAGRTIGHNLPRAHRT